MQFFKHPCNASLHPAIQEIERRYGWAGLGFFWKLVENIYLCNGCFPLEAALCWQLNGLRRNEKKVILTDNRINLFSVSTDGVITLKKERFYAYVQAGTQASTQAGTQAGTQADVCAQTSSSSFKEKNRVECNTHTRAFEALISSAQNDEERDFYKQMTERYPRVCGMTRPLSYQELDKLIRDGFALERIGSTLMEMENHVNLQKKYVSAYLTLRNWLRRG